ncbi:MAG: hypothetical protein ACRDKJ_05890, partial [Actinomycetota bacterium]
MDHEEESRDAGASGARGADDQALTSLLDGATDRRPFAGEGGKTGADFERAVLRDGTPVVIKHVRPDGLVPRMTGRPDAFARLWTSGVFDRMPRVIDHTMLAVEP